MDAAPYKINTSALYMNDIDPVKNRMLFVTVVEPLKGKLRNLLIMESTIWTEYPE